MSPDESTTVGGTRAFITPRAPAIMSFIVVVLGMWGCSSRDSPSAAAQAVTAPVVLCTACGSSRDVTQDELLKLFPVTGLTARTKTAACDKCGKDTLQHATRCPRDGTIFPLKQASEIAFEPCPKCGWTQASALRDGSMPRSGS